MDGLEDFFLQPVQDKPDFLAFRYDFTLEGKALPDGDGREPTVLEEENGDLIIEGWAASFDGLDRQGENFVPGAFERGVKAFLDGQAALCFHHKHDMGIGTVLDLQPKPEGLWMKARVDYQPEQSPLRHIYNAVKKGSYKGLSVGGFFKRGWIAGKRMIADMDFTEISITPVAVHPKTKFAVVAGKALSSDLTSPEGVGSLPVEEEEIRDEDFERLQFALNEIGATLDRIANRKTESNSPTITPPEG
jgi:HK97 family phage prohead protease